MWGHPVRIKFHYSVVMISQLPVAKHDMMLASLGNKFFYGNALASDSFTSPWECFGE